MGDVDATRSSSASSVALSDENARELSNARTQALEVERVADRVPGRGAPAVGPQPRRDRDQAGAARGVALMNVYEGGPADVAGLAPGDVLLEIDGEQIGDQSDLRNREAALAPGSAVTVTGLRAGLPFSAELKLAQRPLPRALG